MNIKQTLYYGAASLFGATVLVACSSGNDATNTPLLLGAAPAAPAPAPAAADPQGDCPTVGNIEPEETAPGECTVTGVLDQDATLTADMTWFLDDRLQVGNDQFTATLSIEAGTQIRGSDADHILVWPGSAILVIFFDYS